VFDSTSAGHAAALPVQFSAGSQEPTEARHVVVAGLKPHAPAVEHCSQPPLQA
jgi:hypothetical protein